MKNKSINHEIAKVLCQDRKVPIANGMNSNTLTL
jgi:hypothetical protein